METLPCRTCLLLSLFGVVFLLSSGVSGFSGGSGCSYVSQFQCLSGQCIPHSWHCDGESDCEDGSDETACAPPTCAPGAFKCNGSVDCVPMRWQCDGDPDCPDGSDEDQTTCSQKTCKADQFACGPSSTCIPQSWQCDGERDCPNGLDEANCTATECGIDQFTCVSDQRCITMRWMCDYDQDCDDGSDEANCPERTCPPDNFMCASDNRCVPNQWKCDGDRDCQDGSDEQGCKEDSSPSSPCSSREFMCADRLDCIHIAWQCDGDQDCQDGSDEDNCENTCGPSMFQCDNHRCIQQIYECDGEDHCRDGSDEHANCPHGGVKPSCNDSNQFDCFNSGKKCIPLSKVCDKNDDCGGGQDEIADVCGEVNPCSNNNGGCSDKCVFNYHSMFHCECPVGFELDKDNKTCKDTNECLEYGKCSQICLNTVGSYHCKCNEGYVYDAKMDYCKAGGEEPSLLFANRIDLRQYGLHTGSFRPLVQDTKSAIALDFDYTKERLFWSDVSKEQINMTTIKNGEIQTENQVILTSDVRTPDGLAYDWVHNNLYYTDTGNNRISVIAILDNPHGPHHHKTLFNTDLDEPRAIVVDPRSKQRWMYWSDWGEPARIEKAGLHGGYRQTVVAGNPSANNLEWPNGLTIDYETNRLFWVDAKLHIIGSCDFAGMDQRTILRSIEQLQHPFAITVFEDSLYWSDWEHESIHKVNKFNKFQGKDMETVMTSLYSPMDVHIYHKLKQPQGSDKCGQNNGGCSHICLPVPHLSDATSDHICACPDSPDIYKLADDQATCVLTRPVTTPRDIATTLKSDGRNADASVPPSGGKDSNTGTLVGIVIGCLLALLMVLGTVGFLCYRSYMRKNVKSMNFDNPVYRKTTEDQFSLEKNQYQPSKSLPSTLEPLTASTNEYV